MNQLPLNKNELPLIREMLTKYKQGYISGLIPGSNITMTPSGCRNKIISSTGDGGGGSSYIPPFLKTGGVLWSGTGLVYDVSTLEYFFNGDKTSTATQVTLGASDPSNNRFDVVVVNEAGVVSVIQGTASSSPEIPPIPETELMVSVILVEAGSVAPTILSEAIYLDDPTTNWTFSTYTTAPPTGTIIFNGTTTPKQGIHCIEANADQRLGARFVRATSFDPYQYTMLSMWVRFTGSNVATNKSLNVRFENGAGALVANTINLFNFGLQRNLLNVWQLVVIPITSFGALPATVKGLKVIMGGGTVGQVRQWDLDYMILTNGSVPQANVPTIVFAKDGTNIASQSGINLIEGTGVTITGVNNPTLNRVDYTINASGGGSPAGSDNQIQINQSGSFFADNKFQKSDTGFNVGLDHTVQSPITFTGSGLDDLTLAGNFSGTVPTTYTVTIDGVNVDFLVMNTSSITGGSFAVSDVVTNGTGGTATVLSISVDGTSTFLGVNITAGTFSAFDVIDNGSGVTTTIGSPEVNDTYTLTDGTTTLNDVPTRTHSNNALNGILTVFGATTGHTLSDSWTWTYSYVNQNVLDFSNNDYNFKSTFGTDTFGYQITDNVFGFGIAGSGNTYSNLAGDFGLSGILNTGELSIGSYIQLATGEIADSSLKATSYNLSIRDALGVKSLLNITSNEFSIANDNSTNQNGIEFNTIGTGLLQLGNLSGGNGTKITIDDVNEQITIGNIKAYDDDAAAGTAGLTAGMVYMTTGSGSAPLNTPGILMIKQ